MLKLVTIIITSPSLGPVGTVDRNLIVVCAQSVAVSVIVREEATLEHLVRAKMTYFIHHIP